MTQWFVSSSAGLHNVGSGGNVDHPTQRFPLGAQRCPGGQSVSGANPALLQTDQPGSAGVLCPGYAAAAALMFVLSKRS